MKNICRIAILAALTLQVSACGKNKDNNAGSQTAVAPMTLQSCTQQTSSYQGGYSPYGGNVPYYSASQAGFCGCNAGEVPACNPGVGMYCVPIQQTGYNYAVYNNNGGNFNFNTYGGYNRFYGGGYGNMYGGSYGGYSNNSCSTGIGQICQVGVVGSCGYGQCIQTPQGYGICAN